MCTCNDCLTLYSCIPLQIYIADVASCQDVASPAMSEPRSPGNLASSVEATSETVEEPGPSVQEPIVCPRRFFHNDFYQCYF